MVSNDHPYSDKTRKHGGLGLGLAITRHLVEMHGGTVDAESEGDGCGATFTVKLPVPAETTQGPFDSSTDFPLWESTLTDSPKLSGIRILAVDDSEDTRELITTVLQTCGAHVITASSVQEGLELFAGWKPHVLICDIGMPEQDGYTFIKKIRQLSPENGGKTPAIALTGYVRVEDRMSALNAGFQMFVPKPIESSELCTVVANLVDGHEQSSSD